MSARAPARWVCVVSICAATVAMACTRGPSIRHHRADGARRTVVEQNGATASAAPRLSGGDSLAHLLRALASRKGAFVAGEPGGSWAYTGDVRYLDAIAAFQDSAVARLVDCLADMRPAAATVNGRPASVGAMCYEALTHMAYYEAYEDRPDGPDKYADWEGDVTPAATAAERMRAQRAWRAVVRARRVSLL